MRKRVIAFVAVASLVLLTAVGCSDNNIDTAKVRAALQSVDDQNKAQLELALTAIDAGKFKDALLPLRKVAFGAKLDKTQGKILRDTMTKVQRRIAKEQ
jgi:hypothetical protein